MTKRIHGGAYGNLNNSSTAGGSSYISRSGTVLLRGKGGNASGQSNGDTDIGDGEQAQVALEAMTAVNSMAVYKVAEESGGYWRWNPMVCPEKPVNNAYFAEHPAGGSQRR